MLHPLARFSLSDIPTLRDFFERWFRIDSRTGRISHPHLPCVLSGSAMRAGAPVGAEVLTTTLTADLSWFWTRNQLAETCSAVRASFAAMSRSCPNRAMPALCRAMHY